MNEIAALTLLVVPRVASPDPGEQIAGLRLVLPPGWTRADQPNQTVVLAPPGVAAGQSCAVTVLAARDYAGSESQWHDEFVQGLGRQYKVLGPGKTGTVGAFRETVLEVEDRTGTRSIVALYTAMAGARGEWLIFEASSEPLFKAHAAEVRSMLEKAELGAGATDARITLGPLSIAPPQGWVRGVDANGAVTLASPDSTPLSSCVLVIGIPEDVTLELKDAHAAMWGQFLALGEVQGKQETGTTGKFTWTAAEVKNPQGHRATFRLYSALAGGKYVRILLNAATPALAKKHLDAVSGAIARAELGASTTRGKREAIGTVELTLPAGWQRRDEAGGWTVLIPPGLSHPTECMAYVRSDHPLERSWWATHHKIWEESAVASGMKPEETNHTPDGPGRFCWTFGRWRRDATLAPSAHVYTALAGDKLVVVIYTGTASSVFTQWTFPLQRMLREANIKGTPAPQPPRIAEAYYCIRVRPVIGATTIVQKIHNDRLILFEGGFTDTSMIHDAGLGGTDYLWKVDPDLNSGTYGRWRAVGSDLHVTREDTTEVYQREGANLRLGRDVWKPMPKLDGLRLKGRFGSKSLPGALQVHNWIELKPDGRFAHQGMFWSPLFEGNPVPVPPEGRGTYEIRDWTIWLKTDTGFVQSQDFFILDDDVKAPGGIWMRSYLYPREG